MKLLWGKKEMRKKIILSIVCFILLLTAGTGLGINNKDMETREMKKSSLQDDISISISQAPGFFGVNLDIENLGSVTLNDVEWSFRSKAAITGTGIFINEKILQGEIDEIPSGETINLQLRPFSTELKSPIGLGNLYMNASAKTEGIYVRTQQRAVIIGFFVFMYKDTYMDIKPSEAYQKYQDNEFDLIIDVVGLNIYDQGHLPGAVNYVWADGTLNDKVTELDPSWTYLVYCHTDPPSTASAQSLVDEGFEYVYRLEGNYAAWKNGGYPTEI